MLTDSQVQVLAAINDHVEVWGVADLDPNEPLQAYLADLGLTDQEVFMAAADLHELGLVEGVVVANWKHPIQVTAVTARGRQELP